MTERAALLHAIRANPADDTARLVYADFLQENGEDERAEFVRWQCARTDWGTYPNACYAESGRDGRKPPFDDWPDSASEVFAEDLVVPARRRGFGFRWHRGFIDYVSITAEVFTERADALFSLHPVEFVTLANVRPELTADAALALAAGFSDIAQEQPHILVGVEPGADALFGSRVPMPIWELLRDFTEEDRDEFDVWPHKTFPALAHALESLSRACVWWARNRLGLPEWEPPCRLVLSDGSTETKSPPVQ